jgi:hypothetical protein
MHLPNLLLRIITEDAIIFLARVEREEERHRDSGLKRTPPTIQSAPEFHQKYLLSPRFLKIPYFNTY